MKKVLIAAGGAVCALLVGVVVAVSAQPDTLEVERSVVVQATPADVAAYAVDLRKVNAWSPWLDLDPDLTLAYSDATDEVGSWYSWDGNDDVGAGKMTTLELTDGRVVHEVAFVRPFESTATATIHWAAAGEGTEVRWAFSSPNDFMGKAFGLFVDMDAMLGADFEKGLSRLKPLVEEAAAAREAAEAEAARQAEAEDEVGEADDADADEAPAAGEAG